MIDRLITKLATYYSINLLGDTQIKQQSDCWSNKSWGQRNRVVTAFFKIFQEREKTSLFFLKAILCNVKQIYVVKQQSNTY